MLQLWKQQQSLQQQTAEGLILKDSKLSQTFRSKCAGTIALLLTCIKVIRDLQIISVGQRPELRRDKTARNYRRDLKKSYCRMQK